MFSFVAIRNVCVFSNDQTTQHRKAKVARIRQEFIAPAYNIHTPVKCRQRKKCRLQWWLFLQAQDLSIQGKKSTLA